VARERTKESLDGFFRPLSDTQRAQISTVTMDMWEPYHQSVREFVPQADDKIVLDRFHLMKYMGEAVNIRNCVKWVNLS